MLSILKGELTCLSLLLLLKNIYCVVFYIERQFISFKSITYSFGPKLWNALPVNNCYTCTSVYSFKRHYKRLLIDSLHFSIYWSVIYM